MKTLLVVGVASIVISGAANAADMPVKAPIYKAPPPVWSWTGAYVGANGGYSWGRWDSTSLASIFPGAPGALATTYRAKVDGWLGGVQAGYNRQINESWVFGFEGDIQATGERAHADGTSASARIAEPGNDFNDIFTTAAGGHWKFPWFATLRGRIGVLADPSLLFYATGGLAVGNFKFSSDRSVTCARFGPGSTGTIPAGGVCSPAIGTPALGTFSFADSVTKVGWTVGAGIEKRFGPSWSVKVEYLYLDFGRDTFISGTGSDTSVRLRDQIVRAGINYAFGAAPVVARY